MTLRETEIGTTHEKANCPSLKRTTGRKAHTLRKPVEFKRVFSGAVRSQDRCFKVLARRSSAEVPRLGIAVSKRNVRLAVDRNRVRRIARDSFRAQLEQMPAIDFVVIAEPRIAALPNQELFSSLRRHWQILRERLCGTS